MHLQLWLLQNREFYRRGSAVPPSQACTDVFSSLFGRDDLVGLLVQPLCKQEKPHIA